MRLRKWHGTHNSVSACDDDSMRLIVVVSVGRHKPHNSVHSTVVGHRQIQPAVLQQVHMPVSAAVQHKTEAYGETESIWCSHSSHLLISGCDVPAP